MSAVEIVEVGPRDGYQGIGPFIPTDTKVRLLHGLAAAGLRRIEVGSFVSPAALPQMRDTAEVLAACASLPKVSAQVLVPSERRGREAMAAGAQRLVFVLSVSEAHNRSNVRRHTLESVDEYARLVAAMPPGIAMRLAIATAFDCPFTGRVPQADTLALLDRLVPLRPDVEIALCDTTGRVAPDHVAGLFAAAQARFPGVPAWAFHAHDTYGLGLANVSAAYGMGVRVFDASFGGLGGCPFAPGATGNVATEDVAWMFGRMGVATGVNLDALLPLAQEAATLPGAVPGGRVRQALARSAAAACTTGHLV